MKITIVCGHFIPAMGYIEVHLARAFAELGHEVSVVTSTVIPPYVAHLHQNFGEAPDGVEVVRLKPFFSLGQIVRSKGVRGAVERSKPDQIIVIGLGKAFPKPALGLDVHTTVLFGDNAGSYGDSSSGKTRLLFEIFKRGTYQKAIDKADRLVAYTPESFEAAGQMLGGKWAKKLNGQKEFISLGFHPAEFYFDENLRKAKRAELGFTDTDKVVITATRLRPEKLLEKAIPAFQNDSASKWLLVGSANDEYSFEFQRKLARAIGKERFTILPYTDRNELNAYYNAADMALFTTPAISIIEAMGSGLPVILPEEKSLAHLIQNESRGRFMSDLIHLPVFDENRTELSEKNRDRFSWHFQAGKLLIKG